MIIECNSVKCTGCNPNCDLAFKSPPALIQVHEELKQLLWEISQLAIYKNSIEENIAINYPYYVGLDSYVVEKRLNKAFRDLRMLLIRERNILKSLHRNARENNLFL